MISISAGIHSNTRREVLYSHLLLTSLPVTPCVLNKVLAYSPHPKCFSSFPEAHVKEGKTKLQNSIKESKNPEAFDGDSGTESSDMKKRGYKKKKSKLKTKEPTPL